jgi:hypothetical protein
MLTKFMEHLNIAENNLDKLLCVLSLCGAPNGVASSRIVFHKGVLRVEVTSRLTTIGIKADDLSAAKRCYFSPAPKGNPLENKRRASERASLQHCSHYKTKRIPQQQQHQQQWLVANCMSSASAKNGAAAAGRDQRHQHDFSRSV